MGPYRKSRLNVLFAIIPVILLLFAVAVPTACAEEPSAFKIGNVSGTLGVREWVTTGYNGWNFQGNIQLATSSPVTHLNVLSDLRWRGIDSPVTEFYGELFLGRFGLLGNLGFGAIDDGVLIDDDFTQDNRRGRWSHTRSTVNDDGLFRWNLDLAGRVFEWEKPLIGAKPSGSASRGYLDVLLGYQYWHEKHVAFGATGFQCATVFVGTNNCASFTAATASPSIKVITQDYTWSLMRIGARSSVPLGWGLNVKGHVIGSPLVWYEMEDVHHLRTNLKHNPSFSSRSENGWGLELNGALSYTLWKGLAVEAGYQYARINSGDGNKFTHGLTTRTMDRLNDTTFERYGPHIAMEYRW